MIEHTEIVPLNPVFLRLGGFSIRWYAVLILIGVGIGLYMATKEGIKKGFNKDLFVDLVSIGLPISIIGGRLYYVLFNPRFYFRNPERIIRVWEGGLAIHGVLIAALLYAWYALRKKKLPLLPVLDIVSVSFFVGQIIGRFGNFMNQEAYGFAIYGESLDVQRGFLESLFLPRFIIDNMFINGAYHHPTFLYEAVWNFIGLMIAIFVLRKMSKVLVGEIAAFYAIWYSVGRIFIEIFRTDSLMIGNMMVAQLISVNIILVVLLLVVYRRLRGSNYVFYKDFSVADKSVLKENRKQAYLEMVKKGSKDSKKRG